MPNPEARSALLPGTFALALGLSMPATGFAETDADESQLASLSRHRVSFAVAPINGGMYIGDFGKDNPPVSDSIFTNSAIGATLSARYAYSLVEGLEVGGEVGLLKPYLERYSEPPVAKLTASWLAAVVRPHLPLSNGSVELGLHGRAGVGSGFWGSEVIPAAFVWGGGVDFRLWITRALALGAELDLFEMKVDFTDHSDDSRHFNCAVLSPAATVTFADL